ncbi:MAG: beta-ketoacyl-[acyl-carrier-protein] synthase family protein, partial [Bacteroidales bacterium]
MTKKILVSGLGIISSIGTGSNENLSSLLSLKSGVGKIRLLETSLKDQLPAAEIKYTDTELARMAGLPEAEGFTRTTLLGIIAAKEAYKNAGLEPDLDFRTGLISATTVGGMCKTELIYYDLLSNNSQNIYIHTHDCGESTERIADILNITGFVATINTACSSSANAIMFGARLI